MSQLIPGLNSIPWGSVMGEMMKWTGYALFFFLILFVFIALFYLVQFRIKATVYTLGGSGKDGYYSLSRKKSNRLRWTKNKQSLQPMFPLFNRIEIKPLDSEYIYPGNEVILFKLNNEFFPGKININNTNVGEIILKPYEVRNWQSLTHKKHQLEFASNNFWDQNKTLIIGLICVAICCILCGVTIYFTYKYALGGQQNVSALADAIKNFNVGSVGVGPH